MLKKKKQISCSIYGILIPLFVLSIICSSQNAFAEKWEPSTNEHSLIDKISDVMFRTQTDNENNAESITPSEEIQGNIVHAHEQYNFQSRVGSSPKSAGTNSTGIQNISN